MQTPTLNINAPYFQPNLHQAPPPPLAQNNQNTNYHTNQQQMYTPPTQPFNTQLPQSFNPQVPPPYFPQYPPTNSPSANSTDSSILLALQKQWERQERLDMERNEMERQKEERKRMKEEREQRKEDRKQVFYWKKMKEDIRKHCKTCATCQLYKLQNVKFEKNLQTITSTHGFYLHGLNR